MKMKIRLHCPQLSMLAESKEAHVRLMAGSWSAFRFSQWPIWLALVILALVEVNPAFLKSVLPMQSAIQDAPLFIFINLILLSIVYFCNRRIENLFHYRRVSELFHIVEAAYLAEKDYHTQAKTGQPQNVSINICPGNNAWDDQVCIEEEIAP
jgi:hypothetical protein